MKKILSVIFTIVLVFSMAGTAFADSAPSPSPSPTPEVQTGERTFSTVSSIRTPQGSNEENVAGIILWSLLLAAVLGIIVYMIYNLIRVRKAEKIRRLNAPIKPKLIISPGYRGKSNKP